MLTTWRLFGLTVLIPLVACATARPPRAAEVRAAAEVACAARVETITRSYVRPERCPVCGPPDRVAGDVDRAWERWINRSWWTGHEGDEARVLDLRPALETLLGESEEGRQVLAAVDRQAPPPGRRTRPGSRAGRLISDVIDECRRALRELP